MACRIDAESAQAIDEFLTMGIFKRFLGILPFNKCCIRGNRLAIFQPARVYVFIEIVNGITDDLILIFIGQAFF